jgi:phosphoglycolate phosphatase
MTAPCAARFAAQAVLIDLDGTLVDTIPDLTTAVNAMRAEFELPALAAATVATYVGKGADRLVKRALTGAMVGEPVIEVFARGRAAFDRHYRTCNGAAAIVFPGVPAALEDLRARGLKLACVTNKPAEFTHPLLAKLGLHEHFDAIVCGGDTREVKPHPAPMLLACELLAVSPTSAIVIGDSINDLLAARAAGCAIVLVETGYNEGQPVSSLRADAIVAALADAALLIDGAV